jgi:SAM-dependent methyltransferase
MESDIPMNKSDSQHAEDAFPSRSPELRGTGAGISIKNPEKDFGPIADDYAFFERHATEAQEDALAHATRLREVEPSDGTVRMLDFGCGAGTFTARLLELVGWQPDRLRLTLVEPVEARRREAVSRLAGFSTTPVADAAMLPEGLAESFNVVLANHVLYYVPGLREHLAKLIGAVAVGGIFTAAIASRTNALIEIWITGFGLLGRDIPYYTSEDVERALEELGAAYEKQQVTYELEFPDTEENRMRIIRFLLADHLAQIPHRPLLELFDQHSRSGRIDIRTASDHFTIRLGPITLSKK